LRLSFLFLEGKKLLIISNGNKKYNEKLLVMLFVLFSFHFLQVAISKKFNIDNIYQKEIRASEHLPNL